MNIIFKPFGLFAAICCLAVALWLQGCAGTEPRSESEKGSVAAFANRLHQFESKLPDNYFSQAARTNEAVRSIIEIVKRHPQDVLTLLTNGSKSSYAGTAQVALVAAGERATNLLPQLSLLVTRPEYSMVVAPILPLIGPEGVNILASGLTNENVMVRRACAGNLTWAIRDIVRDPDVDFTKSYRASIDPYLTNWVQALYDSDKRVALAAASSLIFAGSNSVALNGLKEAIADDRLDIQVRRTAKKAYETIIETPKSTR